MGLARIKAEFASTFIAFNGGGRKLLGERNDIDVLAIRAHESQNPELLKLFEVLPSLEELKKTQVESQLKKSDAAAVRINTREIKERKNKAEQR